MTDAVRASITLDTGQNGGYLSAPTNIHQIKIGTKLESGALLNL
jgi:hypothetical protein